MPGTRCAVAVCNNSLIKTKRQNLNISYHKFPKHNQTAFNAWERACSRKDKWNPRIGFICSRHFKADDFENNSSLDQTLKPRLKFAAVPSLYLTREDTENQTHKTYFRKKVLSEDTADNVMDSTGVEDEHLIAAEGFTSEEKLEHVLNLYGTLQLKYKTLQRTCMGQRKQLIYNQNILCILNHKFKSELRRANRLKRLLDSVCTNSLDLEWKKKKIIWSIKDTS